MHAQFIDDEVSQCRYSFSSVLCLNGRAQELSSILPLWTLSTPNERYMIMFPIDALTSCDERKWIKHKPISFPFSFFLFFLFFSSLFSPLFFFIRFFSSIFSIFSSFFFYFISLIFFLTFFLFISYCIKRPPKSCLPRQSLVNSFFIILPSRYHGCSHDPRSWMWVRKCASESQNKTDLKTVGGGR